MDRWGPAKEGALPDNVWVCPSWSEGLDWLWRGPWPIWDESPAPSRYVWISDCWLRVYSPSCRATCMSASIPPPAELIKELDAASLTGPSNLECSWQSPSTASFTGFCGVAQFSCCFQVGFLAYCCLCSPGPLFFWMRAFPMLSAGSCQPGCSAPQPGPVSTTAASAHTLAQSLWMHLWSPSYGSPIWAEKWSSSLV